MDAREQALSALERTLGAAVMKLLHVHVWQTTSSTEDNPVAGRVTVARSTCRCGANTVVVFSQGQQYQSRVLDTQQDIDDFTERLLIARGASRLQASYMRRAKRLTTDLARYAAYELSRREASKSVRYESLVTIALSLLPRPPKTLQLRVALDAAQRMAYDLDVAETYEYGKGVWALPDAKFALIQAAASELIASHPLLVSTAPAKHSLRSRWHIHHWKLVSSDSSATYQGRPVITQLKRCNCGAEQEVLRQKLIVGSCVLRIRRLQ